MMETVTTTTSVRTSSRGKKKAVVKAEAASLSPGELGCTLAAAGDMVTASFDPSDSIMDVADLENIKVENIADGDNVLFSTESVSVSMPIPATDPQGGSSDMVSVTMIAAIEHDEDIEVRGAFKFSVDITCHYPKALILSWSTSSFCFRLLISSLLKTNLKTA